VPILDVSVEMPNARIVSMSITLIKSIRCAICLCCALQNLVHFIEPNPQNSCRTCNTFYCLFLKICIFHLVPFVTTLSWCPHTFCRNMCHKLFPNVFPILDSKKSMAICQIFLFIPIQQSWQIIIWPLYCPHILLQRDRCGQALANAFVSNASVVAWDPHEGEWRRRPM
jgi:hypothetical protein